MAFNTLDFMLLLAITLILYFVLPHRLRNPLLLIASYVFYAAYSLPLTLFLIVMTLITYFLALEIQRRHNDNEEKTTKYLMAVGVVICLGVLAFFKYFNFAFGIECSGSRKSPDRRFPGAGIFKQTTCFITAKQVVCW